MHFKEHFDIPTDITYLNTPGNGIIPRAVHSWRAEREKLFFELHGSLRDEQPAFIGTVRTSIANTFGASTEQVFCTPNFSFGYSTLLDLLPPASRFLLLDEDYPSLNFPVVSRGFHYDVIPMTADLETDIKDAIQQRGPDVLVLSIVQYINGLKIDPAFIKELKTTFPDLLIIADGTQFMGTAPFDFSESGLDAMGSSGYKWLLSGFGNGFLMLSDRLMDKLNTTLAEIPRPKEAMWKDKSILQTFFEPGHQDTLSHGTLSRSLEFINQLGLENIESHLQAVSSYAHTELQERNLLLPQIADRSIRSSLINIQVDQRHYPELMAAGIKCFPRGSGIRIGIHLYNTQPDVDRLLEILDSFKY